MSIGKKDVRLNRTVLLREVNETLKLLNLDNSSFKPDSNTSQSDWLVLHKMVGWNNSPGENNSGCL